MGRGVRASPLSQGKASDMVHQEAATQPTFDVAAASAQRIRRLWEAGGLGLKAPRMESTCLSPPPPKAPAPGASRWPSPWRAASRQHPGQQQRLLAATATGLLQCPASLAMLSWNLARRMWARGEGLCWSQWHNGTRSRLLVLQHLSIPGAGPGLAVEVGTLDAEGQQAATGSVAAALWSQQEATDKAAREV